MISYNDIYEILRKEKYAETLQQLPKRFIEEFAEYINEKSVATNTENDLFTDSVAKSKKQLENAVAMFKELIIRRKKKILNLVFVATETGIMKRDYENMLTQEREIFDRIVKAFEDSDRELSKTLAGNQKKETDSNKLVIFKQDVEQFVDPIGNIIGPFKSGDLANLTREIAEILITGGKAAMIDESN